MIDKTTVKCPKCNSNITINFFHDVYDTCARIAEEIGYLAHKEATDPQEDMSDVTGEKIAEAIRKLKIKE